MRGEIPVCREISMEMNRIDDLIANPGVYYDDKAMDGFVKFCERELTLTDGTDLKLLETFKLWADRSSGGTTLRNARYTNQTRTDTAATTSRSASSTDWCESST